MSKPNDPNHRLDLADLADLDHAVDSLEDLRSRLVDLEALTHAAAQTLEHLPYIPPSSRRAAPARAAAGSLDPGRSGAELGSGFEHEAAQAAVDVFAPGGEPDGSHHDFEAPDARVHLGRLQSLVQNAAELSYELLQQVTALIDSKGGAYKNLGKHGTSTAREPRAVYHVAGPRARA